MSNKRDRIVAFCCNYTAGVSQDALEGAGLLPAGVEMERVPCTGRLEIETILKAFEEGADAVFVAGCKIDECHNNAGSLRASKRVKYVKKILEEMDLEPGRVEMFFVGRGETEPVVEAARTMDQRLASMESIHG